MPWGTFLWIFKLCGGFLISFGCNSRNVKKDQSLGSGLRLLMQTQTGFPGGKSYSQKDPSARRRKAGVVRRPGALGTVALVYNEMTKAWAIGVATRVETGGVRVSSFAMEGAPELHTWREEGGGEGGATDHRVSNKDWLALWLIGTITKTRRRKVSVWSSWSHFWSPTLINSQQPGIAGT